ncbi:MAG: hypothetical protein ACRD0V_02300, partial [Acidimicrobiales bacterium]
MLGRELLGRPVIQRLFTRSAAHWYWARVAGARPAKGPDPWGEQGASDGSSAAGMSRPVDAGLLA